MDTNAIIEQLELNNQIISVHLDNIASGIQIILYIILAFLVWQICRVLYRLFGGVFLG